MNLEDTCNQPNNEEVGQLESAPSFNYTNEELSRYYSEMAAIGNNGGCDVYILIRRRIQNSEINLANFYKEHNFSLEELKIKGIGERTKKILGFILCYGIEKARELLKERKENKKTTVQPRYKPKTTELTKYPY